MRPVWVAGTALWTPGCASVEDWLASRRDPTVDAPPAAIASSRILRGTSLLTRMQVEVGERAGRAAGFDLAETPTVFASAYGEIGIALLQMDMMREGDGIVSPARFKNSVHNTGSGIFSIATDARGFTTALAGGEQTVAVALLEAWALVETEHDRALVVVADEPLPPPLDRHAAYAPLAVGFALSKTPDDDSLAQLTSLRYDPAASARGGAADPELPAELVNNPSAAALPLLRAIHEAEEDVTVPLAWRSADRWTVSVGPA